MKDNSRTIQKQNVIVILDMIKIPLSVISCPWLFLRPQSASSPASSHFGQNPKNFCGPSCVLMGPAQPCALTHNRMHTHTNTH